MEKVEIYVQKNGVAQAIALNLLTQTILVALRQNGTFDKQTVDNIFNLLIESVGTTEIENKKMIEDVQNVLREMQNEVEKRTNF